MKFKHIKRYFGIAMLALFLVSCADDLLDEQPRNFYEPNYFGTKSGVEGGLIALYAHTRDIYGHAYYYNITETGTDEYTYAAGADPNFKAADLSGLDELNSTSSRSDQLWNKTFPAINTANGIVDNAEKVGEVSDELLAEVRFFRAFDYFLLVQTFGGVPLDLGAGVLKFNASPTLTSTRNTVPEVYSVAIIPDLIFALENLPAEPRLTGSLSTNVARLFLAKVYLTYGWWLENPNNKPTYPETSRVDPMGHSAQEYFQMAYDLAADGIDNPGPYRLLDYFYDVHLAENDRHAEMMLYSDRTEAGGKKYNVADLSYSGTEETANTAVWMVTMNYTNLKSSNDAAWTENNQTASVMREAAQAYGRPWTRMAPTINVVEDIFADKANDSRYDGTFVTSYRGNWPKGGNSAEVLFGANGLEVRPGDAILTFLDDEPATAIDYSNKPYDSGLGVGVLPGRPDFVVSPSGISRFNYPGLWKLGTYRTDNKGGLGNPNGALTRPFPIAKFSEFYFVAAEAAVKGATPRAGKSARELINVIRGRAGKWRFDNGDQVERIEDNSAAMMAATPAVITIDYILDELSREYFGEGRRWLDLVRTQKWQERAGTYRIAGSGLGDHDATTTVRQIQDFHYLRPIPRGQFDAMDMTEAEKAEYQNPGYLN